MGGVWSSETQTILTDTRTFLCPAGSGNSIYFNMSCDEQIAAGDPDPVAHYRVRIVSLTNMADPPVVTNINVPEGTGPVSRTFTFNV